MHLKHFVAGISDRCPWLSLALSHCFLRIIPAWIRFNPGDHSLNLGVGEEPAATPAGIAHGYHVASMRQVALSLTESCTWRQVSCLG